MATRAKRAKVGGEVKKFLANIDGKDFYFIDVEKLPQSRQLYYQSIMQQLSLGIDSEKLYTELEVLIDKVGNLSPGNVNDIKKELLKTVVGLQMKVDRVMKPDLLMMAALTVIADSEEPLELNISTIKQRYNDWKEDFDKVSFFTHFTLTTLMRMKELQRSMVEEYLRSVSLLEIM